MSYDAGMDVLSDILGAVKLAGTLYFTTSFTPPWGVRVPPLGRVARFHLVVRGVCWVRVEEPNAGVARAAEPVRLDPGDLVVVPHGAAHDLSDEPDRPVTVVDRVLEESGFDGRGALVFGGAPDGAPTRMVCGHLGFEGEIDHPLLARLPAAIVIRRDEADVASRVEDIFRIIAREAADERPGRDAVLTRLSEVLFIQALRVWAQRAEHADGLLAALADPHLGGSLAAIHGEPADAWSLDRLSRVAGLSRTVFAERFRRTVGLPPMQYVAFWRMQRARQLLTQTDLTLEAIAERVGYDSAPSFHRAFRSWIGTAPGAYRRRAG